MLNLLKNLLPKGVAVAGGPIGRREFPGYEVEEKALGRAVPKRTHEFRAGRAYARAALSILGAEACGIPVGEHREPIWPLGIVGSITHSDRLSFAIVARSRDFRALGLDIEEDTALDPDLAALICRPEERARARTGQHDRMDTGKLLFVIKEAFYKSYFPVTGTFLEFQDVSVTIDMHDQSFHAELVQLSKPSLAGYRVIQGRFGSNCGHMVAVVAMPVQQSTVRR
jgi:4'-phosphopantetheinyl transferase EntD